MAVVSFRHYPRSTVLTYGDGARAALVGVAQVVGERLQLVGREPVLVRQHVVVRGPARALDARVAAQIVVPLAHVAHRRVHHRACTRTDQGRLSTKRTGGRGTPATRSERTKPRLRTTCDVLNGKSATF